MKDEIVSTRRTLEQLLAKHQPHESDPKAGHRYLFTEPDPAKTRVSLFEQMRARVARRRRSA